MNGHRTKCYQWDYCRLGIVTLDPFTTRGTRHLAYILDAVGYMPLNVHELEACYLGSVFNAAAVALELNKMKEDYDLIWEEALRDQVVEVVETPIGGLPPGLLRSRDEHTTDGARHSHGGWREPG